MNHVVARAFGEIVPVAVALLVDSFDGGPVTTSGGANSYAPASQPAPWGRATPRWSGIVPHGRLIRSIAGLPALSAIVSVGPPLLASGPRWGFATRPGQVGVVAGSVTLPPPSPSEPAQIPRIEALALTVGPSIAFGAPRSAPVVWNPASPGSAGDPVPGPPIRPGVPSRLPTDVTWLNAPSPLSESSPP